MLRGRYKAMLETELDRLDFVGEDILEDFEQDFLPASMTDFREELSKNIPQTEDTQDKEQSTESAAAPEQDHRCPPLGAGQGKAETLIRKERQQVFSSLERLR